MRFTRSLPILVLTMITALSAVPQEPADVILGQWYTEDDESIVRVVKRDGKYFGAIIWLDEPRYDNDDKEAGVIKHDRENPDPSLRDKPLIGLQVLKNFTYDSGDEAWTGGTIYDPANGRTYKCVVRLQDDPEAPATPKLHVRGYIGIPALGRTTIWRRVPPDERKEVDNE